MISIVSVDALYVGQARGLAADVLVAHAHNVALAPVATAIVSASHGVVTDVTDVPADTVHAQLEHVQAVSQPTALRVGVLAGHASASAVFDFASTFDGPCLLDLQLSGLQGETLLTERGIQIARDQMHRVDLLIISHRDAEYFSSTEIRSLDDAQVAAQRIVKQGARAVLIKCGPLVARFFERQDHESSGEVFNSDLYYDGDEFALFEAPHLENVNAAGASSALSISILLHLSQERNLLDAIQSGKQFVSEALRSAQALGPEAPLRYFRPVPTR